MARMSACPGLTVNTSGLGYDAESKMNMKAKSRKSTTTKSSTRRKSTSRARKVIESGSTSKLVQALQFKEFRLMIELVPKTSWYANLRKDMSKAEWDKLRKRVYSEYGHKCGICGTDESGLNCHEIWEYDENNRRQLLIGFIALCDLCHHVKHIGLARFLAARGELDYEKVVEHFVKVNGCDRKTFVAYRAWAFKQWTERSKYNWKVELGEYAGIIENKARVFNL